METHLPLWLQFTILGVLIGGVLITIQTAAPIPQSPGIATTSQVSATAASIAATTTPLSSGQAASSSVPIQQRVQLPAEEPAPQKPSEIPENPNQVHRIEHPYATDPLPFERINEMARPALVNIFCASNNGLLRPISGSGIVIDSRGVVLTNAHVAQYVLLAESGLVNIRCRIRTGSPAVAAWSAHVLYLPPIWIQEHAQDLRKERPFGTGKHDYALIYAGSPVDGSPRPAMFPSLAPDTREAIGFVDDAVLAASYPAEFLGSMTTNLNLYQVTSISTITELFTLGARTVDVISIGSVMGAQSGSSGGGIINAWGRLIGVITTTSDGATTGERTLRGITLSYIDRDIAEQTGSSLADMLAGDPWVKVAAFRSETAPALVTKLLEQMQ